MTGKWYVVNTHARGEAKAAFNLKRQGFETYLPVYSKRRRHARKVETIRAPVFPRYLFVRLDTTLQPWRAIRSTVGVSHLICADERPVPVPDDIVETIRAAENEDGLVIMNRAQRFKNGERVHIADGAFADCTAIFECENDNDRVVVLLELLGRKVRVTLPVSAVVA